MLSLTESGLKNKTIIGTLVLIMVSSFALMLHFTWKGEEGDAWKKIIEGDGKGLYMYLPAIFISHDLDHQQADQRFIFKTETGNINKYFAGTSVSIAPFFAAGYATAAITNTKADGYSEPFQKAVSIAGLFYLCIGLIFLSRLLLLYNIRPSFISFTLLLTVFGTNLLTYAVYHPAFSHVYSFAFITMFVFYAKRFISTKSRNHLLLMGFAFGMIVIIRPTNGIILLLLPFLAGSFGALKETLASIFKIKNCLPVLFIFISIISIQLYLWYAQTGNAFVWSYQNEGFYFSDPQIINVLFSFRKGWFLYTPLALLALGGLILIYRENKFQFYSLLFFLCLLIYITASWWCWYYGPSFGQRPFVEFYAVIALLLALMLNETKYQKTLSAVAIILCAFNLLQSYQYAKNILSSWNMDYQKYKYVFLRTSENYYNCLGGNDDIKPYSASQKLIYYLENDYEKQYDFWNKSATRPTLNGGHVSDFTDKEFNSEADIIADSALASHRLLYAEVRIDYSETDPSENNGPVMAVSLADQAKIIYAYQRFAMNEIPNHEAGSWKRGNYKIEIPGVKHTGDHLKIYVWNKYHLPFYIDNFTIKLYGID